MIDYTKDYCMQSPSKKEKPKVVVKESQTVAKYQRKQWKTLNIVIDFQNKKITNEFYEYKSLQDLYTWLRQELLKLEILTSGSELLLSSDNLKFPLKANTAMTALSSLPTTIFHCDEIIKAGSGDGGLGESTSKYDTRFALPLDTRELEGLNPVQYLGRYCIVSNTWKAFYISIFSSHDKYKNKKLNYKEVTAAMERLFVELAHPLLKRVVDLMGLDQTETIINQKEDVQSPIGTDELKENDKWKANFCVSAVTFVSMCSLANRIICRENEIDGIPVNTIKQSGTQLEDADFYNIEGKLKEHNLNPLTKRLLLYVRNKSN